MILASRLEASEKRVKTLAKERAQNDPELAVARQKLFDEICESIRTSPEDDDDSVEKLWRLCFLKRIEDFRHQIDAEPKGHQQRKIVQEFRAYLAESMRVLKDFADTVRNKKQVLSRTFSCLGDLARYKESLNSEEDKRWTEAESLYRQAAQLWPESGMPHNQLAVLAFYRKRVFVAAYRYERALACSKPFENARRNLKNLFNDMVASPVPSAEKPAHEIVLHKYLLVQAFLLCKTDTIPYETAREIADGLETQLREHVLPQHFKGEVLTALLLSTIFTISNGDVFERAPGDSKKSDLAFDVFRQIVHFFLEKACCDCDAVKGLELDSQSVGLVHLSRSLFHMGLVCDFARTYGFHILTPELKETFEQLDRGLAELHLSSMDVFVDASPDEETEVMGFLPLRSEADTSAPDVQQRAKIGFRILKVRHFVADFVEMDLKPFAMNGEIFTTHNPQDEYHEDEEEEILFRPSFSGNKSLSSSQNLNPTSFLPAPQQFQSLPAFYPFTVSPEQVNQSHGFAWNAPPQPTNGFYSAPSQGLQGAASFPWSSLNWGWNQVEAGQEMTPFGSNGMGVSPSSGAQPRPRGPPPGFQ